MCIINAPMPNNYIYDTKTFIIKASMIKFYAIFDKIYATW